MIKEDTCKVYAASSSPTGTSAGIDFVSRYAWTIRAYRLFSAGSARRACGLRGRMLARPTCSSSSASSGEKPFSNGIERRKRVEPHQNRLTCCFCQSLGGEAFERAQKFGLCRWRAIQLLDPRSKEIAKLIICKPDGHRSENGCQAAVVLEKVEAVRGDGNVENARGRAEKKVHLAFQQSVFDEIGDVSENGRLVRSKNLFDIGCGDRRWVIVAGDFENASLKFPIEKGHPDSPHDSLTHLDAANAVGSGQANGYREKTLSEDAA